MSTEEDRSQPKRARVSDPLESAVVQRGPDELADDPDSVYFFDKDKASQEVADVMFTVKAMIDRRFTEMIEQDCNSVDLNFGSWQALAAGLRYIEVKKKGANCVEIKYVGPVTIEHNWPSMQSIRTHSETDRGGTLVVDINRNAKCYSARLMDVIRTHEFEE